VGLKQSFLLDGLRPEHQPCNGVARLGILTLRLSAREDCVVHKFMFHIGDYYAHTAHLSPMEDLVYRRLIDLYYLHEEPLKGTPEHLARQIRLRDQTKAVATILEEFFQKEEGGGGVPDNSWRMKRCDEEIVKFQDMREGGKKGAAIRWAKGGHGEGIAPLSPPYEPPNANRKPLTNNQEPKKKEASFPRPEDVSEQVWEDFLKARKEKKAVVTVTVMDRYRKQAEEAGISLEEAISYALERNWQGFNAKWYEEREGKKPDEPWYNARRKL